MQVDRLTVVLPVQQQQVADLCVLHPHVLQVDMPVLADDPRERTDLSHLLSDVFLDLLLLAARTDHVAQHQHAGDLHGLEEPYCVKGQEVRVDVLLKHRLPLRTQPCPHSPLPHQRRTLYIHPSPLELLLRQSGQTGLRIFRPLVLEEAVGEGVASEDGLEGLQLTHSRQEVDNLVLLAVGRESREAELVEPVLDVTVEAADVETGSRDDLRDGATGQWTFHVKGLFSLSGGGGT